MQFQYRAVSDRGEQRQGTVEAADEQAAVARLQKAGLVVWMVTPAGEPEPLRLPTRERIELIASLGVMLQSGLTLARALGVLAETSRVAAALLESISRGERFSVAMSKVEGCFPASWIGLVRLGEDSGSLVLVLARLAAAAERAEQHRRQLVKSLVYPAFTLLGTLATTGLMVFFLLPRFAALVGNPASPLPTRALLWLARPGVATALAWVLVVAALILYVRRRRVLGWVTRLGLWRKAAWAGLCRNLALMLEAGMPLGQGLRLMRDSAPTSYERLVLSDMLVRVAQGQELPLLFGEGPPVLGHLVRAGVESGRLVFLLGRGADLLEDEVTGTLETTLLLLEPLLIGLCGLLVAFVMMGAFLPAYRMLLEVA